MNDGIHTLDGVLGMVIADDNSILVAHLLEFHRVIHQPAQPDGHSHRPIMLDVHHHQLRPSTPDDEVSVQEYLEARYLPPVPSYRRDFFYR